MRIIYTAALIGLVLVGPAAEAALPLSCGTVDRLSRNISGCEDNEVFAEAGVLCLRELQKMVGEATGEAQSSLSRSNRQHTAGGANSQANTMAGAASNYQISKDTLNRLLQAAKFAQSSVSNYLSGLVMPDEIAYVEAGVPLDQVLVDSPCYQEPQQVLVWVEDDIYKIIDDLEKGKLASAGLNAGSSQHRSDQSSLSSVKSVKSNGEAKRVESPKGPNWRASDISGTQKKPATRK